MDSSHFASALSTAADSQAALKEATSELVNKLDGRTPDLLAVFVSHHHGPAIEKLGPRLASITGARNVIGCTGESIVGTAQEIEKGPALSLWAGVLPNTQLRPFTIQAAQPAENTLSFSGLPEIEHAPRASLLLLGDPFTFPMREYLEVLNERVPGVPAVGGMASGGTGPGQNFLITGQGVVESGAIGLVVEGEIEIRSVVSQGCRPVGKPYVITACKDHFILKLGGKPAVGVLMETLQSLSPADRTLLQSGPFIGLAVDPLKSTFERSDFLVRGLIGLEPQQGSIAVADNALRIGQTVQFLVRDALSAGEDLTHLMKERARPASSESASVGALVFSCNGRGTRLFAQPNHDISCVQAAFSERVPAAGFFAMGEIGPIGGRNFLHGFTASVALFRARSQQS